MGTGLRIAGPYGYTFFLLRTVYLELHKTLIKIKNDAANANLSMHTQPPLNRRS
jgi:hypothetical protein